MSDSSRSKAQRGRIRNQRITEYDSWAECGSCAFMRNDLPSPMRGRVARILRADGERTQVEILLSEGWKRTKVGWTCPTCAHKGKNA